MPLSTLHRYAQTELYRRQQMLFNSSSQMESRLLQTTSITW